MKFIHNFFILLGFIFLPSYIVLADVSVIFSYKDLENLVLNNHPNMRNSQYDVDIAEDQQKKAEYAQYPRFNLNLGGFPITPYLYTNKDYGVTADWSQWKPAMQTRLNLDIPVYDFGRIKNLKLAANEQLEAKRINVEITKSNLIAQVKQLYWSYLSYNSYKKYIFDLTLPEFEKIVTKKEKKFNEGTIKRKELEDARIDYLDMKRTFTGLLRQKQSLDGQLGLLVGKQPLEDIHVQFKVKYLYEVPLDLQPYAYYLAKARANNPIFKKGEHETLAALYYSEFQKAGIWPTIGFNAYVSYTMLDFTRDETKYRGDIYPDRGWKFGFGFGLSWSLNVWDHIVNYDMSKKNYLKMMEGFKQANRQLEYQLEESFNDMVYQNTQLSYQKEMMTIAQRSFIFTNNAETTGTASLDDITNTLKSLFNRLRAYYDQVRNLNLVIGNFERILGTNIIDYNKAEQKQIEEEILLDKTGDEE